MYIAHKIVITRYYVLENTFIIFYKSQFNTEQSKTLTKQTEQTKTNKKYSLAALL